MILLLSKNVNFIKGILIPSSLLFDNSSEPESSFILISFFKEFDSSALYVPVSIGSFPKRLNSELESFSEVSSVSLFILSISIPPKLYVLLSYWYVIFFATAYA